jgi:uncharacterized protein (TIGR02246 family)
MPAKTPEECDALSVVHLNGGNLEGLLALYEPRATFVRQGEAPARGTAAIRECLAAFVAIHPKFTTDIAKTITLDDGLALLYVDWNLTAKGPDGSAVTMSGKAIEVARRQQDGTWLFVMIDLFGRV